MTLWLTPGRTVLAGELQRQGWCCIPVGAWEDLECSGPQASKVHSSLGGAFATPPPPSPSQSTGGLKGLIVMPLHFKEYALSWVPGPVLGWGGGAGVCNGLVAALKSLQWERGNHPKT